jgi:hypothetical protein
MVKLRTLDPINGSRDPIIGIKMLSSSSTFDPIIGIENGMKMVIVALDLIIGSYDPIIGMKIQA